MAEINGSKYFGSFKYISDHLELGDMKNEWSIADIADHLLFELNPSAEESLNQIGNEASAPSERILNEEECNRIVDMFKRCMRINDNETKYLEDGDIKRAFITIERIYKSTKIQLTDVFSISLANLLTIQKSILCLSRARIACTNDSTQISPVVPKIGDSLRINKIVKWENVKLERNINGIRVLFHYPTISRPQLQILSKLINALKCKEHAVLESPTGTGKTAAIISGVLSWAYQSHIANSGSTQVAADSSAQPHYRIIYLTRTHAQIQQISNAIKQCCFLPNSCILASRNLLCAYKDKSDSDENVKVFCRKLISNTDRIRARSKKDPSTCSGRKSLVSRKIKRDICPYYANMSCKSYSVSTIMRYITDVNASWDIEDLNEYCNTRNGQMDLSCGCKSDMDGVVRKRAKMQSISTYFKRERDEAYALGKGCPYYTAKALSQIADFVICPYPYVIAPHMVVKGYNISSKVVLLLDNTNEYDDCKAEILDLIHEKMDYTNASGGNGFFGSLLNTVVIFDEGHNVENSCIEEGSIDVNFTKLVAILKWLKDLKYKLGALNLSGRAIDYNILKMTTQLSNAFIRITEFLQELLNNLNRFVEMNPKKAKLFNGISRTRYMKGAHLTSVGKPDSTPDRTTGNAESPAPTSDMTMIYSWDRYNENKIDGSLHFMREFRLNLLKVYVMYCTMLYISSYGKTMELAGIHFSVEYQRVIEHLLSILVLLCHSPESYNVSITHLNGYCLSLWLMNPALIFDELATYAHSVIIASGTLTPIPALINSLGVSFSSRVRNNILSATQTLPKEQFMAFLLTHFDNNGTFKKLECNYNELREHRFVSSIGNTIAQLVQSLPGGTLVFFPNRSVINKCIDIWSKTPFTPINRVFSGNNIMEAIASAKINIFKEPTDAKQFTKLIQDIRKKDKFIILAVFRSHFSEGINLKLTSLLLVGLPFPCIVNPQVDISRRYHKIATTDERYDWYLRETFRAVNQAIGRCIRSKDDRGIVVLLDYRYTQYHKYLSSWIHPYTTIHNNAIEIIGNINNNFKF